MHKLHQILFLNPITEAISAVTPSAQKLLAFKQQSTQTSAAISGGSTQPHLGDYNISPRLFQILNGLNTLISPLFSLLQQFTHVTQNMCLPNGH